MSRQSRIVAILQDRFAPLHLDVEDDSARHAGHAGARSSLGKGAGPGGETHFNVKLVTAAFEGVNRVSRSRAVNEALADEFQSGLHALSLSLRAPSEAPAEMA